MVRGLSPIPGTEKSRKQGKNKNNKKKLSTWGFKTCVLAQLSLPSYEILLKPHKFSPYISLHRYTFSYQLHCVVYKVAQSLETSH